MKDKYAQFHFFTKDLEDGVNLEATIRLREEIAEQHRALGPNFETDSSKLRFRYFLTLQLTLKKLFQWMYFRLPS